MNESSKRGPPTSLRALEKGNRDRELAGVRDQADDFSDYEAEKAEGDIFGEKAQVMAGAASSVAASDEAMLGPKEMAMVRMMNSMAQQNLQRVENTIIANSNKVDQVGMKVDSLGQRMTTVETDVKNLNARMVAVETGGARDGGGGASSLSAGSTRAPVPSVGGYQSNANAGPNPYQRTSRAQANGVDDFIPVRLRKRVCVGGFRYSEGVKIQRYLEEQVKDEGGFVRAFSLGSYSNRGVIEWSDKDAMWAFMKKMKGKKLDCAFASPERSGKLWHSIDKYEFEVTDSRKIGYLAQSIETELVTKKYVNDADTAKVAVYRDADSGKIVLKPSSFLGATGDEDPIQLTYRDRATHDIAICRGATEEAAKFSLCLPTLVTAANDA